MQVGDPFTEKLLIEACLELMATDAIVAIQDMGAAGLTSSSVEMAGKGGVGIELDLDRVPLRETGMTRLRDHAVGKPGAHADGAEARAARRRRGASSRNGSSISRSSAGVTDTGRLVLQHGRRRSRPTCRSGRWSTEAPLYDRPWSTPPPRRGHCRRDRCRRPARCAGAAEAPRLRPTSCSQALDLGAVRPPRHGRHRAAARAATPRWCACTARSKALALTTDCTPRYCAADPDARRRAGGGGEPGATSPRSAPRRSRSPTT